MKKTGLESSTPVLLGRWRNHLYFTIKVSSPDPVFSGEIPGTGTFRELKKLVPLLNYHDCAILSYAKSMIVWHYHTRFCGVCGSPTESAAGGHERVCRNSECNLTHYPRTDPAIIVLIKHGDSCLIGRQPWWPDKLYSTLAGFVDPAETLEDAVAREMKEEAGVRVIDVTYAASQPWPFPRSLMLGFTATACNRTLSINRDELGEGFWITRDEMKSRVLDRSLHLPSLTSLAFHLISDWYDSEGSEKLTDVVKAVL